MTEIAGYPAKVFFELENLAKTSKPDPFTPLKKLPVAPFQLFNPQTQKIMSEPTIICPNCHTEIKLTESLAAPLIESIRQESDRKLALKDAEVAQREKVLAEKQTVLTKAQETVQEQVQAGLKGERERIAQEEARRARQLLAGDMEQKTKEVAELQKVLTEREGKLAEAQNAQAELVRKQRELDDAKREMELTIETRVQSSVGEIHKKARREAEESLKLKILEKEQVIESMQVKIEDLKKRAEQGSQQLQGEVLELELESILRARFPRDVFEPVPKGEFGGDILQRVMSETGQLCGTILWESKRTKSWSHGWLAKLRGDQRAARADLAVIVSEVVPDNIDSFDLTEEIWVSRRHCVVPVAVALRHSLLEISLARWAATGQKTKADLLYQYLTGPDFRHRMNAIVEKFTEMQSDLQSERKAIMKMWAKREKQLQALGDSTSGMYGDLQGLGGAAILEIPDLDVRMLPDGGIAAGEAAAS